MKYLIIISLSLFMFFSCDPVIFDEDKDKINAINDAFEDLKNGEYNSAKEKFIAALGTGTDARRDSIYMGLGFVELNLNNYGLAEDSFDNALQLNLYMVDAYYGKMLISYVFRKNYEDAIRFGNRVIELDKDYVFKYSPTSNIKDVYLHLALSEYHRKDYLQSYAYMQFISDREFDVNARQFTSELIAHLSELSNELRGN